MSASVKILTALRERLSKFENWCHHGIASDDGKSKCVYATLGDLERECGLSGISGINEHPHIILNRAALEKIQESTLLSLNDGVGAFANVSPGERHKELLGVIDRALELAKRYQPAG